MRQGEMSCTYKCKLAEKARFPSELTAASIHGVLTCAPRSTACVLCVRSLHIYEEIESTNTHVVGFIETRATSCRLRRRVLSPVALRMRGNSSICLITLL